MARTKPYSRPSGGNLDGAWTNDLFDPSSSRSSFRSSPPTSQSRGDKPSLLSRISDLDRPNQGRGKELLGGGGGGGGGGARRPAQGSISGGGAAAAARGGGGMYSDTTTRTDSTSTGAMGPQGKGSGLELLPDRKKREGALTQALGDKGSLLGRALGGVGGVGPQRTTSAGSQRKGRELLPAGSAGSGGRELLPFSSGTGRQGSGAFASDDIVTGRTGGARGGGGGRELFPSRGQAYSNNDPHAQSTQLGIHGRARPVHPASVWVRVDNLAQGTTPEDVMSAFSPARIISASLVSPPSSSGSSLPHSHAPHSASFLPSSAHGVSVLLEFSSAPSAPGSSSGKQEAEEVCKMYDGALADGNELRVYLTEGPAEANGGSAGRQEQRGLRERMRSGGGMDVDEDMDVAMGGGGGFVKEGGGAGRELLASSGSSRMYSDTLAPPLPLSATAVDHDASRAQRASAWTSSRPAQQAGTGAGAAAPGQPRSLADRVGAGRR